MAARLRNADILAVAEGLAKNHPGIFSLEVWGGATFDTSMRFLKEVMRLYSTPFNNRRVAACDLQVEGQATARGE